MRYLILSVPILAAATTAHAAQPIDVGSRKQLFLDERFIESSNGVQLVMNPPRRDGKVLIMADQPWESGDDAYIGVYSSVIKEDGVVRIWYDSRRDGDQSYGRVAYAESKDGLHFTKPILKLHEIDGSEETIELLQQLNRSADGAEQGRGVRGGVRQLADCGACGSGTRNRAVPRPALRQK